MNALVTGASGFTGSHLVRALEQQGNQVRALVRPTSDLSRLAPTSAELVYGDITDEAALRQAMSGVDMVFHIAAYVDLGLVNEAEMQRVNVDGTQAVLSTMRTVAAQRASPPRLVYCSTIGVYGDTQGQVVDETFQRTQAGFSSAYDRTKYQAQQLVDQAATELPVVSLMPAGILGPDDPHFGPVITLFLRQRLKLWPGGQRVTGIVHVDDLVQALILAAERGTPGAHYIISAGELSTREMFEILSQLTGIPVPAEPPQGIIRALGSLLDPLGRWWGWNPPLSRERVHYIYDRCVRVNASKARQELGWQPRPVAEILKDLVE
ncbi:putative NAD-dependent epimerase [Halomicronema hongdechloris C2206]|uniref:NAD-dependent epimerase n=1 Tax=Halomicronema hongdechloris C2206 TaxID=1641165 RepID=A0A1Z3HR18_9CYAN|nr:NAD-dependent epimerase/dehydratase family protein [Halomicronema hongdechloris]ASC72751.1 putative NAD-dependent epimerase [Halomicronema hongdechloris C2206]